MAPEPRVVPRFAAEPPQEVAPYGRWADVLARELRAAIDVEFGEIAWFPDRTWHGRTYVPATARTADGDEVFGVVSYRAGEDRADEPEGLRAVADVTGETAERNPDWTLDLCDEVVGGWRGEQGEVATMTLVWGVPLVPGGTIATAELGGLTVDQCPLTTDGRFTLLAPDAYRGDELEVALFNAAGEELARESLYDDDAD
ncbi:MAG: hypothetical protein IRZ32_02245 [Solirubrobacteraceae bacterium]|nr:hypothetical protein [Solirubrobacteraceae bacterium]